MSRKTNLKPRTHSNPILESKLTKYLVAGSAVLAAPLMAHADNITYNGMTQTAETNAPVTVMFPGGNTLTLLVGDDGPDSYASVSGVNFLEADNGEPAALNFGSLITAANANGTPGTLQSFGYGDLDGPYYGYKAGNWPQNGNSAYLGLSFVSSGQTYTGWAQISVDLTAAPPTDSIQIDGQQTPTTPYATLTGYAFDNTAGASITAGQTGSSTPEPSSLALFAIGGGAALALLRRRRRAARTN